jgi:hypothetical protein
MGAVAGAVRQRPVSHPRSSNRPCRSPASGSPTGSTVRHTTGSPLMLALRDTLARNHLRLTIELFLKDPKRSRCLQAHRQSPSPRHLRKHARSQGPSLHRHYPASTLLHAHCHFRGLLRLYSHYGPPDRSAAQGDLYHEAPALPVTRPSRSSVIGSIDNSPGGILLHS